MGQFIKLGIATALFVLILDKSSKFLIMVITYGIPWSQLLSQWQWLEILMQPPRINSIIPSFNIVFVWNRGISFGLFDSDSLWSGWIFSALAIVIVVFLITWLIKSTHLHISCAIGLIIGGAIGNVLDRVIHGAVFDFIDIFIGRFHWPAFNVADSAITIGAIILVLDSLFIKSENSKSHDTE